MATPHFIPVSRRWSRFLALTSFSLTLTVGLVGAGPAREPAPSAGEPAVAVALEPTANQAMELLHDSSVAAAPVSVADATPVSIAVPGTRVIWMEVTAYCACRKCCGPHAKGITASGRSIAFNNGMFVAADTKLLPFGTRLVIPGYADGQAVEVIDRGSAIKGQRLDVFFPTHEQAKAWGRRWIPVTVAE